MNGPLSVTHDADGLWVESLPDEFRFSTSAVAIMRKQIGERVKFDGRWLEIDFTNGRSVFMVEVIEPPSAAALIEHGLHYNGMLILWEPHEW